MFKRGVKLIPLDSRPPVRLHCMLWPALPVSDWQRSCPHTQIHIDLLPWVNDMLVSPYGVIVFTIALLPLARLIYSFGT